ncbi:eukaryotic aspartyl protease family protein [Striga asiatica]|uniref:Eukaryotic aspartyl protease family protein n=1 Tax=Striga asiatica TaxID=4170 RepID=A0A5A7P5Y9_STRAF|nr:eukaryotic aspartyl protease family protein [Striga asiatica]
MAFYYTTTTLSLLLLSISSSSQVITVDLIRRGSPGSPGYDPSKSPFDLLRSSFHRSSARKSSFHHRTTTAAYGGAASAPVAENSGEYLMTVGLGTPPMDILAIADTGSDLTWTQCQPCTSCYSQRDPVFDPRNSSTFRTLTCGSRPCSLLDSSASTCASAKNETCNYQYSYGDSSYTLGELSSETLTLGGAAAFRRVSFGCGHENGGTFSPNGSGIVGLGGGPLSIVSQLGFGQFSYCLTLIGSDNTSTIEFGPGSGLSGPGVVSTRLVKKDPPTFYYLTLEGVSVGSTRLKYLRQTENEATGNIIIDSGTTLTFLPSEFYEGFEGAIVEAVKGKRVEDSEGTFKVCYRKEEGFRAPTVEVHFSGGADVELEQDSTFLEVEEGVLCLTIVPSEDIAIFGNLHQMNYRVGYDVTGGKVGFLKTDCAGK